MRDLVLAQQFEGNEVIFACRELEGNIIDRIPYRVELVRTNEMDELIALIRTENVGMLVIDHYGISYEDEKRIKEETGVEIFALDDTYQKHHCDILLNHNISADANRYKGLVPQHCEIRCGVEYTLIRAEFREEKQKGRQNDRSSSQTVLVAMGGTDSTNLNQEILKVLDYFPQLRVELVTTSANRNLEELKATLIDKPQITLHIDSDKMAMLMNRADLVITTPSVTVNEAIYLGVPFVTIVSAENQMENYHYLKAHGYRVMEQFDDQLLKIMIENMTTKLLNFTQLTDTQKQMVLSWRNSDEVRKWMLTREPISWEDHLSFIKGLKERDDRQYFLLKSGAGYLGVIDLTDISDEEAQLGIYANPAMRGVGDRLMRQVLEVGCRELGLKKLIASVFRDNKRAIKLYRRHGFVMIEDGEVIKMERKCENR